MKARNRNAAVWVVLLAATALASACRVTRTYAVVPRPPGGYRVDTLRAIQNGNDVRVIFRFDTVTHTRTVYQTDTLWREGKQIIRDTVRLVRRDTIRVVRRDTIVLVRRDTVRMFRRDTVHVTTGSGRVDTVRLAGTVRVDSFPIYVTRVRVDTVRRTDTVYQYIPQPTQQLRRDTVRLVVRDTVYVTRQGAGRVDTVRMVRVDTVRFVRTDTVRVVRTDTVRIAGSSSTPARRTLRVPPGHYPPEGQCRVWIQDRPPGQQRDAAPCDALGNIPAGAFVLFGGEAWDFDYDWVANPGGAPPQIVALKRKR